MHSRNEIQMKTEISDGHRSREFGRVTDLYDESCFRDGTMHELAVIGAKTKTSAILRAAAQVFAERGYHAATINDIAEYAGIAKGTVYLYFRSKYELFFGVCYNYIAAMERIGEQAVERSSTTAAAQIQQHFHTLLAMSTETRNLLPLILEFCSASASPHRHASVAALFRGAHSRLRRLIADQIRKGQQEGVFDRSADASQVAAMFLGALVGTFFQASFDPDVDAVCIGDQFVTILLRGLAAPEEGSGNAPTRKQA
jgi:AcrR family transcriptional regulator